MTRRRRDLVLLVLSVLFYWIGLYLYVPTLPTYIQTRTDSLASVGVVLSMYGLLMGVLRLPVGIASDRLGRRKPFIVVGMALVGIGAWAIGSSHSMQGLVWGRALTGIAATTWVPMVVLFSGRFAASEAVRVTAMLTLVLNVGRILATSLTGWLNGIGGYPLAFYVASGAAAVGLLLILPVREDTPRAPKITARQAIHLIRRSDVLLPAVLSAINLYADYAVTFGFMPILAEHLGAGDAIKSALVSSNLGMVAAGSLCAALLVRRIGARSILWTSITLLPIGMILAAGAPSLPWLFVSQLCFGFAAGTGYSVCMGMSIQYVDQKDRATAMGLHQAVYASGMFAGPWASGLIADAIGIRPMFVLTAFACFIASVALVRTLVRHSLHGASWRSQGESEPVPIRQQGGRRP